MQDKSVIQRLSELPTAPTTIGTMVWNETGDWRYLTPLVADKLAPCSQSCPAGIPIPQYLGALNRGDAEGALTLLLAHNPLPGLTGRLCYHPCQVKCVRKTIDRTIAIQKVELFLGDLATDAAIEKSETTDRRATVVGSGPLGLSCAFYLGCRGYRVTIVDPSHQAGGALAAVSPGKIEPQVLSWEINRLVRLADIRLETGVAVDLGNPADLALDADVVIIDPTGFPEGHSVPAGALACNPFDDNAAAGQIISVELPHNLVPFKAPMIAHYIAAGRMLARKLSAASAGPDAGHSLQPINGDDIKIGLIPVSGTSGQTETGQDEPWDRSRAAHEAERCLSCGTCNLCLSCASYCPDSSILPDEANTTVAIDLDHCKGCGICAYECPRGVITMEDTSL